MILLSRSVGNQNDGHVIGRAAFFCDPQQALTAILLSDSVNHLKQQFLIGQVIG